MEKARSLRLSLRVSFVSLKMLMLCRNRQPMEVAEVWRALRSQGYLAWWRGQFRVSVGRAPLWLTVPSRALFEIVKARFSANQAPRYVNFDSVEPGEETGCRVCASISRSFSRSESVGLV